MLQITAAPNLPVAVLIGSDIHTMSKKPITRVTIATVITGLEQHGTTGGI